MSRPIDADRVMKDIKRIGGHNLCEWSTLGVKALIDRQPTIDAVEVVRCKDCKHFRIWGDSYSTCAHWTYVEDVTTDPNAFCSYGERREK